MNIEKNFLRFNMEKTMSVITVLKSLLTNGVATIISFGINFFITPYISSRLGVDAYGFISLAMTFASYAAIVTTALDSFAVRYVALEYHAGHSNKASVYFSSLFFGNVILSVSVFLIALPLCIVPGSFLNVSKALITDVSWLFLLVFFNFTLNTCCTSLSVCSIVKDEMTIYGVVQAASYLAEALVLILLYCLFPAHIWYFGFALLISSIVQLIGFFLIYRTRAFELRIDHELFSIKAIKELFSVGIWSSINNLGNVLNNGIGLLISNILIDASSMGVLAIAKTFSTVFTRFYQLISQSFYPHILKAYSEGDTSALLRQFDLAVAFTGTIASILFAGFFALSPAFYRLWIPGEYSDLLYVLTMLSMVYSFIEGPIQPLYYIYSLTLKNKIPTLITVVGGLLNILCMVPLINLFHFGVTAIPATTAVIMIVISLISNPLYMAHCLHLHPFTFYPSIFRCLLCASVCCGVFKLVASLFLVSSWVSFLFAVAICTLAGIAICFVVLFGRLVSRKLL